MLMPMRSLLQSGRVRSPRAWRVPEETPSPYLGRDDMIVTLPGDTPPGYLHWVL